MPNQMNRVIRQLAPAAALLIFLVQVATAAGPETKTPAFAPQKGCGVKLLKDRDYLPALLDGIDHARLEIALSAIFFKTKIQVLWKKAL